MTSVRQLTKDIEVVKRALGLDPSQDKERLEEDLRLLREYSESMERATRYMTPAQKSRFQHDLAKQVAKEFEEGKLT